jgi:hypothetical protein
MTVDDICFWTLVGVSLFGGAWCLWDRLRPLPPRTPEQERADLHARFLADNMLNTTATTRRKPW